MYISSCIANGQFEFEFRATRRCIFCETSTTLFYLFQDGAQDKAGEHHGVHLRRRHSPQPGTFSQRHPDSDDSLLAQPGAGDKDGDGDEQDQQHQGQPVSAAAARVAVKLFRDRIFNQMFNN
jgi:hypothetical protein